MRSVSKSKRFLAFVLAIAMAFTLAVGDVTPTYAASAKAVKSVTLKINSKNVTKKTSTLKVGQKVTIKTTVKPSAAKKSVAYKSSKTSVATVSKTGKVTAKKAGTAKITVTVTGKNKKKKSTYVTIKVQNVAVSNVKLSKTSQSMTVGQTATLKATISPSNATNKTVSWSSNNTSVATVSKTGKITAKKAGTATITAKSNNGKKATCKVTVKAATVAVTGVTISKTSYSMETGSTVVLTADVLPANASVKTLTWTSSNPSVATVSNGTVKAVSAGTAVITATASNGKKASCTVTVSAPIPVTSVAATIENSVITIGHSTSISAVVNPVDASDKSLTYKSLNEKIAVVNSLGIVTGMGVGKTEIQIIASNGVLTTVSVSVEEQAKEGITLEVRSPYEGKDGTVYSNTVLVGTTMLVRARVVQNGEPLANAHISLALKAEYGGNIYDSSLNPASYFTIRDEYADTDSNGYAEFLIGLKSDYSDITAVDGFYQSYTATATTATDQGNITEAISIKFASVYSTFGIDVDNNYYANLPNIDPSENASAVDTGIATTLSTNGLASQQYVTSQKVTMADGTDDNRVYFDAAPRLLIPATVDSVKTGTWKISREDGTLNGGTSGSYSVYNDETNTTTTTTVYDVPAGLQYITLKFNKINLSQYTYMGIDIYGKETGMLLDSKEWTANAEGVNASVQVGRQYEEDAIVVISIQSQGIVDTSNEGYDLYEISGPWASTSSNNSRWDELKDTVTWTDVSNEVTYQTTDMTYTQATQYLPSGSTYLNSNYTYTCAVPVFPYTGNAVIRVYNSEKTNVLAYFLYPTVRQSGDNVNVLAAAPSNTSTGRYAVYASKNEAENLVSGLSTLIQDGNEAIVDSTKTGMTELKASISIAGLSSIELNEIYGGELYTSVLWSPNPRAEETETIPDYFAVEGQNIVITAQLYDFNNNPVSDSGKNVSFTYGEAQTKITAQGQNIGGDGEDSRTQATVSSFSSTTDMNGQIQIRLSGTATSADGTMKTSYVENLTATASGYQVALSFDQDVKPSLNVTKGDLYWVDLGTSLVDDAINPGLTFNFADTIFEDNEERTTTVDKSWYVGYKVVARSEKFGYIGTGTRGYNEFISASGIPIIYSKNGKGSVVTQNSVATISSQQTGIMNLTGTIDATNLGDVVFTYYDEYGDIKVCPNVGVGESTTLSNTGIQLKINWNPYGLKFTLDTPDGTSLHKSTASAVYVKVTDLYGNMIEDQTVTYTITGVNATAETANAVKVAEGIYKITLPAPNIDGTSYINVNVGDDTQMQQQTQITYSDQDVAAFGIRPDDGTNYAVEVVASNQLKVYFTNAVKSTTLMKEQFKFVQDGSADVTYEVLSAEASEDNNAIILTLDKDIANTGISHTLTYSSYTNVDVDNIEHNFMDNYGQKMTGTTEVSFVPSERKIQ